MPAQHVPADRSLLTRAEGFIGGIYKCQKPTAQELKIADEKIAHLRLNGSVHDVAKFGERTLENYLEDLLFQEMAFRSHKATTCQIEFLERYIQDRAFSGDIDEKSWKIYEALHPALFKMLASRNNKASMKTTIQMGFDPGDKSVAQAKQKEKAALLGESIGVIDFTINQLIAQVPLGSQKMIQKAVRKLAERETVSKSDFTYAYSRGLQELLPKMKEAEEYFVSMIDKDKFYKISRGDKIAFMKSGMTEEFLKLLDPGGDRLACRVRAQYSKGAETTQFLGVLLLVGASLVTDGAAGIAAGLLLGASMVADIAHQCFRNTTNFTAQEIKKCDPMNMAHTMLDNASMMACGLTVGLTAIPALAPYLPELRAAYKSLRGLRTSPKDLVAIERMGLAADKLASSGASKLVQGVERKAVLESTGDPIVVVAPKSLQFQRLSQEVEPYLKSLPLSIQNRLRLKFASQPDKQTIQDMKNIRDLRRLNAQGVCK